MTESRGYLTLMIVVMYSKSSNSSLHFLTLKIDGMHSYFDFLDPICIIVGAVLPCRHAWFLSTFDRDVRYMDNYFFNINYVRFCM